MTGENSGQTFVLGGKVRVQIAAVDVDDARVDLKLVRSPGDKDKQERPRDDGRRKRSRSSRSRNTH
jgi:ribonuclease R